MAHVIAGQTISLDGFVADIDGSSEPLYPDLADLQGSDYMNAMIDETNKNGGLIGRKVAAVYHGYDATSQETSDQQDQEACADWTQDHHVFVLPGGTQILDECAKKAGTIDFGGGPTLPDT